jgi:hypothetical protein
MLSMVDRVFALWQALHPNSYVEPRRTDFGTFTTTPGSTEDVNTSKCPPRAVYHQITCQAEPFSRMSTLLTLLLHQTLLLSTQTAAGASGRRPRSDRYERLAIRMQSWPTLAKAQSSCRLAFGLP